MFLIFCDGCRAMFFLMRFSIFNEKKEEAPTENQVPLKALNSMGVSCFIYSSFPYIMILRPLRFLRRMSDAA